MFRMASFGGIAIGVICFSCCLKHLPIRTTMIIANLINCLAAIGQILFLKEIYLGMNPAIFYGIVEMISDAFSMAFIAMPALSLVAKLIPHSIESAMFAFFTGLTVLNYFFLAKVLGNLINLYFNVTKENLEPLWKLHVIQAICSLIPMLFIWLLPKMSDVYKI